MKGIKSLIYLVLLVLVTVIAFSLITTIDFDKNGNADVQDPGDGDNAGGDQSPGNDNDLGNDDDPGNNLVPDGGDGPGDTNYGFQSRKMLEVGESLPEFVCRCSEGVLEWEMRQSTVLFHAIYAKCSVCQVSDFVHQKHNNLVRYERKDDNTHYEISYCTVCDYEHTLHLSHQSGGVCPCETACDHAGLKTVSLNDTTHKVSGRCAKCGKAVDQEQPHVFDPASHLCGGCGYRCGHTAKSVWYTNVSAAEHSVNEYCRSCGYSNSYVEPHGRNLAGECLGCGRACDHTFNGGALCTICGLSCDHSKTKQEIIMVNFENHAFKETCKICSSVLYYGEAQHDFTEENSHTCLNCGYCDHLYLDEGNGNIICAYCGKQTSN